MPKRNMGVRSQHSTAMLRCLVYTFHWVSSIASLDR